MAKWEKAIERTRAFLQTKAADGITAQIYTWPLVSTTGVRVAEVSFSRSRSGASYMQVDLPWGAAVCLCTERLIIAYATSAEDVAEEEERLAYVIQQ